MKTPQMYNICYLDLSSQEIIEKVYESCYSSYQNKSTSIARQAYPVIKDVYENQSATYENIVIPFTDGLKTLQVVTNLKEAHESEGGNIAEAIELKINPTSITLVIGEEE